MKKGIEENSSKENTAQAPICAIGDADENENSLSVPKTPEKKNPVKHIANIETPFKIASAARSEVKHPAEEGSYFSKYLDIQELEEEEKWFRKKKLGRKTAPFKLVKNRASQLVKGALPVCPVEHFFASHFKIKKLLYTSGESSVYLVEAKKRSAKDEEHVCSLCHPQAEAENAPAKESIIKVARKKWVTDKEKAKKTKEAKFLYRMRRSRYVVKIIRAWEEKAVLYIETNACNTGTLKEYMKTQENNKNMYKQKLRLVLQMIKGLKAVHQAKIVHMDIKPENIFLNRDTKDKITVQIGDFGISRRAEDRSEIEFDGDRLYMAPEVLENTCSFASDIYSIGLVFIELLLGISAPLKSILWSGVDPEKKAEIVQSSGISEEFYDTVKKMISYNPQKRPTATEVLRHVKEALSTPTS